MALSPLSGRVGAAARTRSRSLPRAPGFTPLRTLMIFALPVVALLLASVDGRRVSTRVGSLEMGLAPTAGAAGGGGDGEKKEEGAGAGSSASVDSRTCSWEPMCASCVGRNNCGWCNDCGRCLEGGEGGPASQECMAWNFNECQGGIDFDRLMARDSQLELRQRADLEGAWRKEHDNFVEAKKRRGAGKQGLEVAMEAQKGLQDEVDEVKVKVPMSTKLTKKMDGECDELKRKSDVAREEADTAITKHAEAKDKSEETSVGCDKAETDDDKNECVGKKADAKTKVEFAAKMKTEKTDLAAAAGKKAEQACRKARQQSTKHDTLAKSEGDAAEALSSQAALVELRRGQIAAAETEMKRAKATAALIAAKLKDITSKLTDLRAKRQANGTACVARPTQGKLVLPGDEDAADLRIPMETAPASGRLATALKGTAKPKPKTPTEGKRR